MTAAFRATTGPKRAVTGASTTPTAIALVLSSRLEPPGAKMAVEANGLVPWEMADHTCASDHADWAGSPHPQVRTEAGWPPVHTGHHTTTAATR